MRGPPGICRCRSNGDENVEVDSNAMDVIPGGSNEDTTAVVENKLVIDKGHKGVWKKVKRGFKVLLCQ